MEVARIDECDAHRRTGEAARAVQSREATANDHDMRQCVHPLLRPGDGGWITVRYVAAALPVESFQQLGQLIRIYNETRQPAWIALRVIRAASGTACDEQHNVVFVAQCAPALRIRPASLPRELAPLRPFTERQGEAVHVVTRQHRVDRQFTARDL